MYIDVGVVLIRHLDRLCWDELSDDWRRYNVAIYAMHKTLTVNHTIAADKGDTFIKAWYAILHQSNLPRYPPD